MKNTFVLQEMFSNLMHVKCSNAFVKEHNLILQFCQKSINASKQDFILRVRCTWRLRDGGQIIVAPLNEEDSINKKLHILKGTILDSIEKSPGSHDLKLRFANGLYIETFSDSLMYGQWCLENPKGIQFLIGPGLSPQVVDPSETQE